MHCRLFATILLSNPNVQSCCFTFRRPALICRSHARCMCKCVCVCIFFSATHSFTKFSLTISSGILIHRDKLKYLKTFLKTGCIKSTKQCDDDEPTNERTKNITFKSKSKRNTRKTICIKIWHARFKWDKHTCKWRRRKRNFSFLLINEAEIPIARYTIVISLLLPPSSPPPPPPSLLDIFGRHSLCT